MADFYYLLAGMMDVTNPDSTDPVEELVQKRLREAVVKNQKRTRGRLR